MEELKVMFTELFRQYSVNNRLDMNEIFLIIATVIASRSTCNVISSGAVIVDKHNQIISMGYCGAPSGFEHCCDRGDCWLLDHKDVGKCLGIHAPVNAIINAKGRDLEGSTIYIAGYDRIKKCMISADPCPGCLGAIKNAGIENIITTDYEKPSQPV
jgi:dCMP deaminase